MLVPLMMVPHFLGLSRCWSLRNTCRDWLLACHAERFRPPTGFEMVLGCDYPSDPNNIWGRRLACMALLSVLGATDFAVHSMLEAEDSIYWLLVHVKLQAWTKNMILTTFHNSDAGQISKMIASLQPKCKLPMAAVGIVFKLQRIREQTIFFNAMPLHYAVIYSSVAATRMLLATAARVGTLAGMIQDFSEEGRYIMLSPLFIAILFAEKNVVDVLRCSGAQINSLDAKAALRLQIAGLGADLWKRMEVLHLSLQADELHAKMRMLQQHTEEHDPAVITELDA